MIPQVANALLPVRTHPLSLRPSLFGRPGLPLGFNLLSRLLGHPRSKATAAATRTPGTASTRVLSQPLRTSAWLFLLLAVSTVTRGLTVVAPTFAELVDEATAICRVEVTAVRSQWDESPGGPVIHTYVRCRVLRALKGKDNESFELRLLGGQVGEFAMDIPDLPSFRVGDRCILFVTGNGTALCPLVGAMHGCYRLAKDDATGTERVLRNNRHPLTSIAGVQRAMERDPTAPGMTAAIASALTTDQFETAILSKLSETRGR